ncbi:MAG TPA: S16 family serine protease, partial [Acidimicrobiales bacterium]|nr:S16 family serine protease [Acidimicrobiales bacterium]
IAASTTGSGAGSEGRWRGPARWDPSGRVAGFRPPLTALAVMAMMMTPTMTTTSTEPTRPPILPTRSAADGRAPEGSEPERYEPRADRRWWLAAAAGGLLAVVVFLAAVVQLPYLAYRPGGAQRVEVAVHGAPNYQPEAGVAFTTVSTARVTLLEALRAWVDDSIELTPTGGQSRAERVRYNAVLMDVSKVHAITVALRHLGYPVTLITNGTVVRSFVEDSPAEGVLQLDDVIVAVDGSPVERQESLRDLLQVGGTGAAHVLTVERPPGSATRVDVEVTTIASEDDPSRAVIGILAEERIVDVQLPTGPDGREWEIAIDSGDVGGPSAGLAFALTILDVLTPGELTGGHKVAVTGTMELDGTVGPVGGGLQKSLAVRNAGYEAFLVPTDEYAAVHAAIGEDVRVIAVDTLQEALDALDSLGGNVAALEPAGSAAS